MNQITELVRLDLPKLHIFDYDNTLIRHDRKCIEKVPVFAGRVIHAYTGNCPITSGDEAIEDFKSTGDGFHRYRDLPHDFHRAMHRSFNSLIHFTGSAYHDPDLPNLLLRLADFSTVCVVSHSTQMELEISMTKLGYSPALVDGHIYGLERLSGFKHDMDATTLEDICAIYGMTMADAFLVEDSQRNIDIATEKNIGGYVLINDERTTGDFLREQIAKFENNVSLSCNPKGQTCSPV